MVYATGSSTKIPATRSWKSSASTPKTATPLAGDASPRACPFPTAKRPSSSARARAAVHGARLETLIVERAHTKKAQLDSRIVTV